MDPIGWVVAITAVFTALSGWYLANRAQKDKDKQEQVALKIAEDNAHLKETQQSLDAYERVVAMHQREIDRLQDQNETLNQALSTERAHMRENNKSHGELIERYRRALMSLLQAMILFRNQITPTQGESIDKVMSEAAELMKGED